MTYFGLVLLIIILFYFLGRAADVVVFNIKEIGKRLGIPISFLGFLLGFFTSLPEVSIAVNSSLSGVPSIALGNLLGGVQVLFGLVLGLNILFHRIISTRVAHRPILFIALSLFLPLLLAVDGELSQVDGAVLVLSYLSLLVALFVDGKKRRAPVFRVFWHADVTRPFLMIILSTMAVAVLSSFIIRFTSEVLAAFPVPPFLVGLLLFSIGTNLPEIIISFRAYQNHQEELSLSNIIGSAMANVVIIGLMALVVPLAVATGLEYVFLCVSFGLLLGTIVASYRTGGKFTRKEGAVLLGIYALFVAGQAIVSIIDVFS